MIKTLEEAMIYIAELEDKNKKLEEELEHYKSMNQKKKKKHDATWMNTYKEFEDKYISGMSIMEIVESSSISRRTAYRYKAYYEELMRKNNTK